MSVAVDYTNGAVVPRVERRASHSSGKWRTHRLQALDDRSEQEGGATEDGGGSESEEVNSSGESEEPSSSSDESEESDSSSDESEDASPSADNREGSFGTDTSSGDEDWQPRDTSSDDDDDDGGEDSQMIWTSLGFDHRRGDMAVTDGIVWIS